MARCEDEGDRCGVPESSMPSPVAQDPHGSMYTEGPSISIDLPTTSADTPSMTGIEDTFNDEIIFIKTTKPPRTLTCPGYMLHFPSGQTPHSDYPHALHDAVHPPWDYASRNGVMILRSSSCTKTARGRKACSSCADLESNKILIGIKNRMKDGVHENAPYAYHSHRGKTTIARRKGRQNDFQRMRKMNLVKKLAGREGKMDAYKQMLFALSDKRIPRLNSLLRTARRRNLGLHAIINLIKLAAKGVFHPKDYEEEEDMQALLMLRLAGARVANISHRMHGSPAASTVRRRTTVAPLIPSPSTPKETEIKANIESSFDGIKKVLTSASQDAPIHAVLMFDELASEKRLRIDDRTNMFVGLDRKTAKKTSLLFNDEKDLDTIMDDLERGEVRLASEVSIGSPHQLFSVPHSFRPLTLK